MLVLYKKSGDKTVFEAYETYDKCTKLKRFNKVTKGVKKLKKIHQQHLWSRYPQRVEVPYFLFGESQVEDTLQKIESDIIHLHWINSFVNFTEKEILKKSLVWTLHDSNPFTGLCHSHVDCGRYKNQCGCCPILNSDKPEDISNITFLLKQKRYKKLNLQIVCPSKWMTERVKESSLLGDFRVTTIQHGLDATLFSPVGKDCAKEVLKLENTRMVVLYGAVNARQNRLKGYHLLDHALQHLKEKYSRNDIQIIIFGESEISDRDPYFDTKYLGNISDDRLLSIIYSAADVMVVPSIQESFGQTASEALACGTPVAAFATSGLLDIVDHKRNGYLARPFESHDLAEGIKWCLENNYDGNLSQNAREKVMNNFTLDIMTESYQSLYESILNR